MTTGEAARVLGLSPDMVRLLERGSRLPAQRTRMACTCFGAVMWSSLRLRALEQHGAMDRVWLFRTDEHARLAAELGGANEQEAEEGWKGECPGQ